MLHYITRWNESLSPLQIFRLITIVDQVVHYLLGRGAAALPPVVVGVGENIFEFFILALEVAHVATQLTQLFRDLGNVGT